jgi:hypothetical protein
MAMGRMTMNVLVTIEVDISKRGARETDWDQLIDAAFEDLIDQAETGIKSASVVRVET